jgi:hypothetical protein
VAICRICHWISLEEILPLQHVCMQWNSVTVLKYNNFYGFQINRPTRLNNFSIWRLLVCTAQHVSGVLTPIIRSLTAVVAASGCTIGAWW